MPPPKCLAWAGIEDEVLNLLESWGSRLRLLAPAFIARDPVFTVPLADNARYKALSKKLEAEMAAAKLE